MPRCSKSVPTNFKDDMYGVMSIMRMIESDTGDVILTIFEDRSSNTFIQLFKENRKIRTEIIADLRVSYPKEVAAVEDKHIIVNRSKAFKNNEGFYKNNMENLWTLLKTNAGLEEELKIQTLMIF